MLITTLDNCCYLSPRNISRLICSLYIPPHDQIDQDKLEDVAKQLPKLFILLDFNDINTMWESKKMNKKGKIVERFMDKDLSLLNQENRKKQHTSTEQLEDSQQLTCVWSRNLPRFYLECLRPCGSDHFPVILTNSEMIDEHLPKWTLSKADWEKFEKLI